MTAALIFRSAILVVLAVVAGIVTWRAMRSRILPHRIPFEAWWIVATVVLRGRPWLVLAIALVIGAGAGLQSLFMFFLPAGPLQAQLPVISTAWQAVMATLCAGLVAPIQMFVLERSLVPPPNFSFPRSVLKTSVYAAWWGLLLWLLGFASGPAVQGIARAAPSVARDWIGLIAPVLLFLIFNIFALIRPALALGARNPLTVGVSLALRNYLPLTLVQAILLIPPEIIIPICVHAPKLFLQPQDNIQPIIITLGTSFTILQFLAVEVANTIFTRRADFVRHALTPGEWPPPIFAELNPVAAPA